jgi:glycosyltransferase involved in cell wall biosynthesis
MKVCSPEEGAPDAAQPRPRIVALTHEFYPQRGGIATYTHEVARAASLAGYPIEVWAPETPALSTGKFDFPVRALPAGGDQSWPSRIKLARCLMQRRESWAGRVLWLPEPGPMRALMYFSLLRRMPVSGLVITLHGSEISRFTSRWYRKWLFGRLLHSADRISVVSRFGKESLLSVFPELEPKLCIAHGALRSDVPGMAGTANGALKNGRIVILTVGRVHPRKGQMAVIEALARLEPAIREGFLYRCVGPLRRPAYLHKLEDAARDADVAFEYAGELEPADLNYQYLHADIFAMTSEQNGHSVEGFGLTYLEASSYGLPIVAHRTGGVADAVRHDFNGLKVEPDDRAALAEAFCALAQDQALRSRLGENGRRWAQSFSWERTAHTLFDGLGQSQPSHSAARKKKF